PGQFFDRVVLAGALPGQLVRGLHGLVAQLALLLRQLPRLFRLLLGRHVRGLVRGPLVAVLSTLSAQPVEGVGRLFLFLDAPLAFLAVELLLGLAHRLLGLLQVLGRVAAGHLGGLLRQLALLAGSPLQGVFHRLLTGFARLLLGVLAFLSGLLGQLL